MNVESHGPRLDLDGLRLHPLAAQKEEISIRKRIPRRPLDIKSTTAPRPPLPPRPLNIDSTIPPNSSKIRSMVEHPSIAESLVFDDHLKPDFENVKYRMPPQQSNDRETCVDINPSGSDYPGTCLASHPKGYTADAGLPPQTSAENPPVLPPRRVTLQRSASPTQSIQSGHDTGSLSPQTTTMSNHSNNEPSTYTPLSPQNTMSNDSNGNSNIESVQSDYDVLSPTTVRCALATSRIAAWRVKKTDIKISALAAAVLVNEGLLTFKDLEMRAPKLHHSQEDI
jgi:hypothetical protein